MSEFKFAHVVWDCKYHIVLVPKYRYAVFEKDVKEVVRDKIKKLFIWMEIMNRPGFARDRRV